MGTAVKWPGHSPNHSAQFTAEAKNEFSHTSSPPYAITPFKGTTLPLPDSEVRQMLLNILVFVTITGDHNWLKKEAYSKNRWPYERTQYVIIFTENMPLPRTGNSTYCVVHVNRSLWTVLRPNYYHYHYYYYYYYICHQIHAGYLQLYGA